MSILETIQSPADLRALDVRFDRARRRDAGRDFRCRLQERRASGLQPRRGRADHRPSLHLRLRPLSRRPGSPAVGRRASKLFAQTAHRPGRPISQASQEGLGQRLPLARRIALRPVCRRSRRHRDQHRRRHGPRPISTSSETTTWSPSSATLPSSTAWPSKASTAPAPSSGRC